jgi:stress response protein YsnF
MADELEGGLQDSNYTRFSNIPNSRVLTEEVIALLEERLIVEFAHRKIGEVVIRKEIESHTLHVQVPVRREKLIVEQVSPEYKRLAEIDLGQNTVEKIATDNHRVAFVKEIAETSEIKSVETKPIDITASVDTPEAAIALLTELTQMPSHDFKRICIEVTLKDSSRQDIYEALFKHYEQT